MLIGQILKESIEKKASDVIISSESYPYFKIDGEMIALTGYGILTKDMVEQEANAFISPFQKEKLQQDLELDFSIDLKGYSRFRVNALYQRRGMSIVFRIIRNELPKFEDLMLPPNILDFVNRKSGLLLITWWVWTGKSTTMSVLLDHINATTKKHIITVEDPIEYVFENKSSVIEQREVGVSTRSFENGLKYALREASDVIMIWEMRDLETFRLALRAAETGNLVIATLHTSGAARTVARVIDMFGWDEKEQVKQQLSESLIAVVWQDLLKKKWGGRIPTVEILVNTTSVANIIRRGQTHQLPNAIETGRSMGMIPMKKSLEILKNNDLITPEDFENYSKFLGRIQEEEGAN